MNYFRHMYLVSVVLTLVFVASFSGAAISIVSSDSAFAQVTIPSSADPSRQRATEPIPLPGFDPKDVTTETGKPQLLTAPEGSENIKLTLNSINVEGSQIYSPKQLSMLYVDMIGDEITVGTLYDIANSITRMYHEDGFILSRAFIPPQESSDGNITIKVIEGFIGKVEYETEMLPSSIAADMLSELDDNEAPNIFEIEKYSLLLNRLPGVSVRLVLAPMNNANAPEGSVKLVVIPKVKNLEGKATVNNTGSQFIGPFKAQYNAKVNHLVQPYHSLDTTVNHTPGNNELQSIGSIYTFPINRYGTLVRISGDYSRSELGFSLESSEVEGNSTLASISLEHPIILSRQNSLYGRLGFNYSDSKTSALTIPLFEDNIRYIDAWLTYNGVDKYKGSNSIVLGVTQGIDVLGSSKTGDNLISRADAEHDFTKANFTASRLQDLGGGFNSYFSVTGQHSLNTLFSSQEFGFGGTSFGRAYDSSELTGEHGIAGMTELSYRFLAHDIFKFVPFVFYDYGKVWDKDVSTSSAAIGSSAGLGMYVYAGDKVSATVYAAKPLARGLDNTGANENPKQTRFFFTLSRLF